MISMADYAGGFGEKPKPTVKVWMGEGRMTGFMMLWGRLSSEVVFPVHAAWICKSAVTL
jgi:hypothetical protein